MPVDFEVARATLEELFAGTQALMLEGITPQVDENLAANFEIIFATASQSYREALLGIALVRIQDQAVNLRLPYVNQGPTAYNGRDLDEQVVNLFLQEHRIPSSRGPYLAMFRRDFRFDETRRAGQRDKAAFDAFLELITALERTTDAAELRAFLGYLLFKFAELRERHDVSLSRLQRISLEQFDTLITSLLNKPSGGRLPVFLVVAALRTITENFQLDWTVDYQGINVADTASGASGDITVTQEGRTIFAAEVTERPIDQSRVMATFNTKIAPAGIEDYLFFVRSGTQTESALPQARQYFAQGHEVNFLEIRTWVLMVLATTGRCGREVFNRNLLELIGDPSVPRAIKVAWNESLAALTAA